MPNKFSIQERLNPGALRFNGQAFPQRSIENFAAMNSRRSMVTVEVMSKVLTKDILGGQSFQPKITGQYSAWIQQVFKPNETMPTIGNEVISTSTYYVGLPASADISLSDSLASPGWLNEWQANTEYEINALVIPSAQDGNGFFYSVVEPGESDDAEPEWLKQEGSFVADGTCRWQLAGEIHYLKILGNDASQSVPAEKVFLCEEMR